MKSAFLAIAALVCSFNLFGTEASQSFEQFCADRSSTNFVKDLAQDPSNLLSFRNRGGIANGGVCWWHTRFQRNALYLTIFHPDDMRPTPVELKTILDKIRLGKEPVFIGGFGNFFEFAQTYQAEIQKELEHWQDVDGIVKFNWVIGLSGSSVVSNEKMKKMMDELYQYVEVEGNIAYQKLQMKGISSHAWLVVHMKTTSQGYDLQIIDSNYPSQTSIYRYHEGQTSFFYPGHGPFTPYLERKNEMEKINMTILKYCHPDEYEALTKKGKENKSTEPDFSPSLDY